MLTTSNRHFANAFPVLNWLSVNWGVSVFLVLVSAGLVYFLSPHYALSLLILGQAFLIVKSDMVLVRRFLLSPLVLLIVNEIIRMTLGPIFLAYSGGGVWQPGVGMAQIATLIYLPCVWLGYRVIVSGRRDFIVPYQDQRFIEWVTKPLVILGILFLLYAVISTVFLIGSGVKDRGIGGEEFTNLNFGVFSPVRLFQVFARFKSIGWVLLPLVLFYSPRSLRLPLLGLTSIHFVLSLLNGDRGNVIWPLISIGIGCYVFLPSLKIHFEKWITLALPFLVLFIWVIDVFRNSDAFSQASAIDLESRMEALMNVGSEIKDREVRHDLKGTGSTFLETVGGRFWGGYDHLIFTMTPGVFPHAWFENFSAMPTVWIPYSISGNREGAAIFGDAYIIASTYRGSFSERARYGISIVGDMYRRFSWIGLPIAAICFGIFYGCYWKIVFWVYERKSKFLGLSLLLLMFTLFLGKAHSTIMSSWKLFAYDIPKYFLIILFIYFLLKRIRNTG